MLEGMHGGEEVYNGTGEEVSKGREILRIFNFVELAEGLFTSWLIS